MSNDPYFDKEEYSVLPGDLGYKIRAVREQYRERDGWSIGNLQVVGYNLHRVGEVTVSVNRKKYERPIEGDDSVDHTDDFIVTLGPGMDVTQARIKADQYAASKGYNTMGLIRIGDSVVVFSMMKRANMTIGTNSHSRR